MKTYGYIRVSTADQAETGSSLQMQQDKISAYCTMKGLAQPTIFQDAGISGKKSSNRPALQELLSKIEEGDILIVYSLSRFMRNTVETLNTVSTLTKKGISFVSLSEDISTSSPSGKFFLTVLAGLAQLESETTGQRISSVLQNRKGKNQTYCKSISGFKNTYDLTEEGKRINGRLEPTEHLETIKEIFRLNKQGLGAYAISTKLNTNGVKSVNGNKFYQSSIIKILNNPIYHPNINTLLVNTFQKFGSEIPATII